MSMKRRKVEEEENGARRGAIQPESKKEKEKAGG